ncbi:MAG TPA: hypothetical protein ENF95_00480, partial [Candidatus Aenigmarchaeota archaeon]|nr:hypothetical protein [Candidatus Aenigmarchaeota archaeon]
MKLNESGLEEYPKSYAALGNFFMILSLLLGALGIGTVNLVLAWAYLITSLLVIYIVMRKLVCTKCYY